METRSSFDKILLTCIGGIVSGTLLMTVPHAVFIEAINSAPAISTSLLGIFVFVAMLIITFIALESGYGRETREHYDRRYEKLCKQDRDLVEQLERMYGDNER